MTRFKRFTLLAVLAMFLVTVAGVATAAPLAQPAAADGPNLLKNPGFENPYGKQCCQTDMSKYFPNTLIDEVQVAQGWLGWWVDADVAAGRPGSCDEPGAPKENCVAWHRPEWREANCGAVCANRVRTGHNAQKYFTFYSVHDAGMYQTVSGVTSGQRLRFSVYMMGWSTNADYGNSGGQQSMGMQVGIDPTGGANPFSSNVVWSTVSDVYDAWGLYTVEAVARGSSVTVFTRSRPIYPLQHNDIYVDDASLVVIDGSGSTTGGTLRPTSAPVTTGIPYVVQKGDNFYRIARRFGINVNVLMSANPTVTVLQIGQTIILPGITAVPTTVATSGGGTTVSATRTPAPAVTPVTYVVQPKDNLYRIAIKFNTTVERLRQLNNLKTDIIQPGQVLIVGP